MNYTWDNDLHIHSSLSLCAKHPEQTAERILKYAKENNLKTICVTDHCWDGDVSAPAEAPWYRIQNFDYVSSIKPLPQCDGIKFIFGVETEIDKDMNLGLSRDKFDKLDFIIIPTTHLHEKFTIKEEQKTAKGRMECWINRFDFILNQDLPFNKVGLAHPTCSLLASSREELLEIVGNLPEDTLKRLFHRAAKVGMGIEINKDDMKFADNEADILLRPYKIAKQEGCKFYMGSDAHTPDGFNQCDYYFNRAIDYLELTEEDKFHICK